MGVVKTWNGIARASVKTFNGLASASWKTWNGLDATNGFTPWEAGINFRASSGFVVDGANETYCLADDLYGSTSRGGFTFGWESGMLSTNDRDRSNAVDRRLAGINFDGNVNDAIFRLDLPAAGTYEVRIAAGDASAIINKGGQVRDDASVLFSLANGTLPASGRFYDATDTVYTTVAWPGSNTPQTQVFASTILRYVMTSTGGNNAIAHIHAKRVA